MSKNFDLLQKASRDQDLFQLPREPQDRVTVRDDGASSVGTTEAPGAGTDSERNWQLSQRNRRIKEKEQVTKQEFQSQEHERRSHRETVAREEGMKLVHRLFSSNNHSPQVVLFSGVDIDGECASICARAGEILAAQIEGSVCIVDANLGSPSMHRQFHMENFKGLAQALLEPGCITDFAHQLPECNLWVMPAGLGAEQLSFSLFKDRLRQRMAELRARFTHTVIHAAPFSQDDDSILLSRTTDGVVLVVEANSTRRDLARRVKDNLSTAQVPLLGAVLNNRTFPIPEALYRRL